MRYLTGILAAFMLSACGGTQESEPQYEDCEAPGDVDTAGGWACNRNGQLLCPGADRVVVYSDTMIGCQFDCQDFGAEFGTSSKWNVSILYKFDPVTGLWTEWHFGLLGQCQ
jgi:hypothetical protein